MSPLNRRTSAAAAIRMFGITAITFAISLQLAEAQTSSLYIPGFEPQPVSADNLGVGADGRTTWALHQGKATHASDQSESFIGTATLVEGSNDASLTYANSAAEFTIGQICSFSEAFAICTLIGGGSTAVQTELISHVPVQVATSKSTDLATTTPTTFFSQSSVTISRSNLGEPTVTPAPQDSSQTQPAGPSTSNSSPKASVSSCGPFITFVASLLAHVLSLL